jgi:hypothetical protein
VPQSKDDWLDQHWDRAFARHTSQVETVKLVVTFSLAVAATLVASALQSDPKTGWDQSASVLLGLAFIATLISVMLDRLKLPSRRLLLQEQEDEGWDDPELMANIQKVHRDLEEWNDRVVHYVRRSAEYQLILAATSGVFAVVSLFQ